MELETIITQLIRARNFGRGTETDEEGMRKQKEDDEIGFRRGGRQVQWCCVQNRVLFVTIERHTSLAV